MFFLHLDYLTSQWYIRLEVGHVCLHQLLGPMKTVLVSTLLSTLYSNESDVAMIIYYHVSIFSPPNNLTYVTVSLVVWQT